MLSHDSKPTLPRHRRPATRLLPLLAVAGLGWAGLASSAVAAPEASFEVEAQGTTLIQSSAFGAQSYRLRNEGTEPIVTLRIDLGSGPAMFPDIVFDPAASAGNEIGKPFTVDAAPPLVTATPTYIGGSDPEGYTALGVSIAPGLAPGEELKFSIDTDPTVVRDAVPGPNGKISGAEHHGATVQVTYTTDTGNVMQTNDLHKDVGSDIKSSAKFPASATVAPVLTPAAGIASPSVVSDPTQPLTVSGPVGASGIVLVAEGHLFLGGAAGFDVDPFEANVLVGYSEYPFTIGADGTAQVPVMLTRRLLSSVGDAPAGLESEEIGRNYISAWFTGGNDTSGPVSAPLVLEWDGTTPVVPPVLPPNPIPQPPAPAPSPSTLIKVPDGVLGLANCQPIAPAAPASKSGGQIELSVGQLRTNQRIGQAAIRRLNAIQNWLDDGIVGSDLCGGTLGPRELGTGLVQALGAAPFVSQASPRPLKVKKAAGSGKIALTPAQLRINQRIYRAALLRARALDDRLRGKLTGGDVTDGSLSAERFALPLTISAGETPAAASQTKLVRLSEKGSTITLSAPQLRTNQKIAQQAVREANALRAKLERGLLGTNFKAGSIGPADLSPGD